MTGVPGSVDETSGIINLLVQPLHTPPTQFLELEYT